MPERPVSPREEKGLPYAVGLCPVHQEEFFFPMDTAEPERCPEPGCEHTLEVYITIRRVLGYRPDGVEYVL